MIRFMTRVIIYLYKLSLNSVQILTKYTYINYCLFRNSTTLCPIYITDPVNPL